MRALTPIEPDSARDPEKFMVTDIESAAGWINFLIIGLYDGENYWDFTSLDDYFKFLFSLNRDLVIFAHFGGKYDFLFLLDFIFRHKDHAYLIDSMIPRGSGILSFDLFCPLKSDKKIAFRDSSALLPHSLRSLCDAFHVEHKKMEVEYDQIKEVTPELREYLKYDCKGLFEVLHAFYGWDLIRQAGPSVTIAGQAMKVLRLFLEKPIPALNDTADAFVRKSYFGGRTEIFKPVFNGKKNGKKLKCWDVNSLYPTVMEKFEYPGGLEGFTKIYNPKKMGFFDATVYVPENMYVPPLPTVQKIDGSTKLVFPTGTFSGSWSTCELEYAKSIGVKIIKTGLGVVFKNAGFIFKDYVQTLYKIRETSKKDSVENVLAKLLLNSCYGRFGLNRDREMIVMDQGQLGVREYCEIGDPNFPIRLMLMDKQIESFTNVAIANWVTAQARIHMHKLYMEHPESLYYTDTDSLFTTEEFADSKGLGGLKLEYECSQACFLLPKTYLIQDIFGLHDAKGNRIESKATMKGFDRKKIQHFQYEDFLTALEGDLRLMTIVNDPKVATFRSALQKKHVLMMTKSSPRSIRSKYDKRTIIKKNGVFDTVPLHLE